MKGYDIFSRMSGGSIVVDPIEAEDTEDARRQILERLPEARKQLMESHPNEELEEVEIYELVKVATIDLRPRITV